MISKLALLFKTINNVIQYSQPNEIFLNYPEFSIKYGYVIFCDAT